MLAEGHNSGEMISFTNTNFNIMKEYSYLANKIFNQKICKLKRENEVRIYNKLLAQTLQKIGFTNSSWTKYIPEEITTSNEKILYKFLGCFIDCDGHLTKRDGNLEICLASKRLIDDINFIFLRIGLVCVVSSKKVKGRIYSLLRLSDSLSLSKLNNNINLLIKHKKERLQSNNKLNFNPNIDIIPNISSYLRKLLSILNMNFSETNNVSISNYVNRKDNPSRQSLFRLLESFEKKFMAMKSIVHYSLDLFNTLPEIDEQYAYEIINDYYSKGLSFEQLSQGSGISGTTIRRMVRKITKPTNNIYKVAETILAKQNQFDYSISKVNSLNFRNICLDIMNLCSNLGYELKDLCKDLNMYNQALYNYCFQDKTPLYSVVYKFATKIKDIALNKSLELTEARNILKSLRNTLSSNLFFDEIISVEKIKSEYEYVYDLEVEQHNFVANNLVIHNSFCVSAILEEIMEKKIPIIVIDPHGEYSSLKYPSDKKEQLKKFGLEAKGYYKQIQEYSPDVEKNPEAKPLKLNAKGLTGNELMHLLPAKLSGSQIGLLYGAMSDATRIADFDQVMLSLQAEENNAKWALINVIDYLKKLNIFADIGTSLNELVSVGKCSVINLRGIPQEIQEIVVYKLLTDLFTARKQGNIPPFFLVVEESHNFIPERSYGEAKSSGIIRQILAEGRKFGLGVAAITQRPARIEKSVLANCTTQIILKITNPNDLRSISSSVEGITSETESEIINLHVGKAMIIGIADMPLFVEIRPRKTRHGGESIDIVGTFADAKMEEQNHIGGVPVNQETKKWNGTKEVLSMIRPKVMKSDIRLLVDKEIKNLKAIMIPCYMINCVKDNFEFNVLFNLNNGNIVTDVERGIGKNVILNLDKLSEKENKILNVCFNLNKEFTAAEIFSKSGLMFSEAYDIINNLVKKNLFLKNNDKYVFGEGLNSLINLKQLACYEKNEFISFEFDDKLESKYNINEIVELLKRFVEIKNYKECNLVKYDVEYI